MKIEPPVGPPPGPKPEELKPGAKTDAPVVSFAEKLQGASAAPPAAQAAQSAQGPQQTMSAHLEAVSDDLRTGKIQTKEEAVSRLVDRVLDSKFGGKVPPASFAQMKSAVAAQIAADPHLSERIDGLLKKAQGG